MRFLRTRIAAVIGFFWPLVALGHGLEEIPSESGGFFIFDASQVLITAGAIILFFVVVVLIRPPESGKAKAFFFWAIALPIMLGTLYLAVDTINENRASATGGPVHWHADFRIYDCGKEIELLKPSGLSNRIGTPEVHEHGDQRIHIEGVLQKIEEASLHSFFEAIGGKLTRGALTIPTPTGLFSMQNGSLCSDGKAGMLRVFLWQTKNSTAFQRELADYSEYVISPEALVPPGDCVIFDFTTSAAPKTDKICHQYDAAEARRDIIISR